MLNFKSIMVFLCEWYFVITHVLKDSLKSRTVLEIEIIESQNNVVDQPYLMGLLPTSAWITQQLREATPYGMQPEYLIHDNDRIFVSKDLQTFLVNTKIKSVRTGFHSPWQNRICERVAGIPAVTCSIISSL